MTNTKVPLQQLDPLGVLDSWPTTVGISGVVVAAGGFVTFVSLPSTSRPFLSLLALAIVILAFGLTAWSTRPTAAPLRRGFHLVVVVLLVVASFSEFASSSLSPDPRGSWVPYAVGLSFCTVAGYRSARELAFTGIVTAAAVAAGALLSFDAVVGPDRFATIAIVVAAPILAVSLAVSAYVSDYGRSVVAWRAGADADAKAFAADQRAGIETSVHDGVLTVLNREMLPFFTRLLEKDSLDAVDSGNARRIAESVRAVIVADIDQNWLEGLVLREFEAADPGRPARPASVADPDGVAEEIGPEGRAVLTALVSLIVRWSGSRSDPGLSIVIRAIGEDRLGAIEFDDSALVQRGRTSLRPYLSVMHVTFDDVRLVKRPGRVTIRFRYGHSKGR